jgi:hypothetical protein
MYNIYLTKLNNIIIARAKEIGNRNMTKREIWDFWARYRQSEHAFMQNKPNFKKAKMNVTLTQITSYLLPFTNYQYAKQTQSSLS